MRQVAIIGLGLMGGSLGLALKSRCPAVKVCGAARREETRRLALGRGAVDEAFATPEEAVAGADVVVLCTPILSIPELVRQCLPGLAGGCVVTDVGSAKKELVARMRPLFSGRNARFVGSHPIAGSEQAGIDAAKADLYERAVVVVTPEPDSDREAVARIGDLWEAVGSRVVMADPAEHDRLIARSSHLPHVVAAMVAANAGRDAAAGMKPFCGPGFRDTTRVADGAPNVWHDIIQSNRSAIVEELKAFGKTLSEVTALIETGRFEEIERFLEDARRRRRELLG